jgi:ribosomal protein L29
MMTFEEISALDLASLNKELAKSHQELLKMKLHTGDQSSKETHKLKELRKHIARMETAKHNAK